MFAALALLCFSGSSPLELAVEGPANVEDVEKDEDACEDVDSRVTPPETLRVFFGQASSLFVAPLALILLSVPNVAAAATGMWIEQNASRFEVGSPVGWALSVATVVVVLAPLVIPAGTGLITLAVASGISGWPSMGAVLPAAWAMIGALLAGTLGFLMGAAIPNSQPPYTATLVQIFYAGTLGVVAWGAVGALGGAAAGLLVGWGVDWLIFGWTPLDTVESPEGFSFE